MRSGEPEPPSRDHLHQQVIGALRRADANPQIEFPIRAEVIIDHRKELMLLQVERIESCNGPVGPVILKTGAKPFRDAIGQLEAG
jgi:hypothetical protein